MSQPTEATPTKDKTEIKKPAPKAKAHRHNWSDPHEEWGTDYAVFARIEDCDGCEKKRVYDILEDKDLGVVEPLKED